MKFNKLILNFFDMINILSFIGFLYSSFINNIWLYILFSSIFVFSYAILLLFAIYGFIGKIKEMKETTYKKNISELFEGD